MIPTLRTERLTLRAPRWDDFEAYTAFRTSPRSATTGGPFTRAEAFQQFCALLGHWQVRGYGRWMVADAETENPLGVVGLYYPEDWPEPEVAWSLFDEAEGKGYAYEAALAARDYAFGTLGWTSVISLIDPANTRSVALARRLGCLEGASYAHPKFGNLHYWHHPAPDVRA